MEGVEGEAVMGIEAGFSWVHWAELSLSCIVPGIQML